MLTNPRAERVRSVRALAQRSVRRRTGRFLVEGPQGVREAVRYAAPRVDDVYLTPVADRRHPEIAAEGDRRGVRAEHPDLGDLLRSRPRLLVVLANVRDPGNAGTVIRAADAFGADAVLVCGESVDVHAPKVVRSTVGSLFHLPVLAHLDLDDTLEALSGAGIRLYGTAADGALLIDDADLGRAHAWVLGNEAWGLPASVADACDAVVGVPIAARCESLNLAMAATVCLYSSNHAERTRHSR